MTLGHVAAVSRVIDSRTVLLRHANWSPIDGRRGQIEDDVAAVDVSPDNDWSQVRVWYAPIQNLGTTAWPVVGLHLSEHVTARPALQLASADARDDHPLARIPEGVRQFRRRPPRSRGRHRVVELKAQTRQAASLRSRPRSPQIASR